MAGEIFNVSRSGCLFVTPVLMKVGERIEASLPLPGAPSFVFTVVRTRAMGGGTRLAPTSSPTCQMMSSW